MSPKLILRTTVVYVAGVILASLLMALTWGATSGYIIVRSGMLRDKGILEEARRIRSEEPGGEPDAAPGVSEYEGLGDMSPEAQRKLEALVTRELQHVNWFAVTLLVSACVFSIVAFLCGFLARSFLFIGVIPALSLLTGNPLHMVRQIGHLGFMEKGVILVFGQFGTCYLFGYLGTALARKIKNRTCKAAKPGSGLIAKPESLAIDTEADDAIESD